MRSTAPFLPFSFSRMELSFNDQQRYARHLILREFGEAGQARLRAAHLVVVGAGALGSASLAYLAAAGVGRLTIIDPDRVELSNLQRQILYETGDVGRLKVESAVDMLSERNPEPVLVPVAMRVEDWLATAPNVLAGVDAVLDGCDDFATRFVVSDACVAARVPLVSAAVLGWQGTLGLFAGPAEAPCYRCFVPEIPPDAPTCRSNGVLGPLGGMLGAWQAVEAIKLLLGCAEFGRLWRMDALTGRVQESRVVKDPACPACAKA